MSHSTSPGSITKERRRDTRERGNRPCIPWAWLRPSILLFLCLACVTMTRINQLNYFTLTKLILIDFRKQTPHKLLLFAIICSQEFLCETHSTYSLPSLSRQSKCWPMPRGAFRPLAGREKTGKEFVDLTVFSIRPIMVWCSFLFYFVLYKSTITFLIPWPVIRRWRIHAD